MVLADLDAIFVQAKFNNDQRATGIAYVSMETAREDDLQLEPAFAVEQCECPDGYEGFSCEVRLSTLEIIRTIFNFLT